jgi:four helix bundle protein
MSARRRHNYKNLKIWKLGLEISNEVSARTYKSFSHFLDIALGSSFELGTQLLVAKHRKYINQEKLESLEEKIEEFQKMTMGFQNGL